MLLNIQTHNFDAYIIFVFLLALMAIVAIIAYSKSKSKIKHQDLENAYFESLDKMGINDDDLEYGYLNSNLGIQIQSENELILPIPVKYWTLNFKENKCSINALGLSMERYKISINLTKSGVEPKHQAISQFLLKNEIIKIDYLLYNPLTL